MEHVARQKKKICSKVTSRFFMRTILYEHEAHILPKPNGQLRKSEALKFRNDQE